MLLAHTSIYLLGRVGTAGLSLVTLYLFSRLFAPAEYGQFVVILAYASVIQIALFQWLRVTLLRHVTASGHNNLIKSNIMALFGLLALLTFCLGLVGLSFKNLQEFSFLTALTALSMAWAELCLDDQRARLRPGTYTALIIAQDILALGLTLLLWWQEMPASMALIAGFILSQLLPTLPLLRRFWAGIWPPRLRQPELGQILRYGLPLAPAGALSTLSNNADRLLLPIIVGTSAAGMYGPAYSLARQTVPVLMQSVNLAAFPLAIRALEKSPEAARQQLADNLTLLLLIGLPATLGLAILAPAIAYTLLGPAYAGTSATLLPWLALGWFLHSLRSYYTEQAFQLAKNTRPGMWITMLSATLALSISALCLWQFGLDGAALGAATGAGVALLLSALIGRRIFPLPFPLSQIARLGLASACMAAIIWPQRDSIGFIPLTLAIGSGGAVYLGVVLATNVLNLRHQLSRLK